MESSSTNKTLGGTDHPDCILLRLRDGAVKEFFTESEFKGCGWDDPTGIKSVAVVGMVVVESGSGTTDVSGVARPGPSIDELIGFIKGMSPGAMLPVSGGDEVGGTCDKVDGRQVVDGDEDEDEVVDVECT
jgi:hypothetical protein